MPSSDSLLTTDSLSSNEPVLSDGSVGSAPSLGLSPGPTPSMDMGRGDLNPSSHEKMMKQQQQKAPEVSQREEGYHREQSLFCLQTGWGGGRGGDF